MSTLTTYRTSVQLKGYDSLVPATIDAAIQEGRRRVLTDARWSFAESSSSALATTAGTTTVSLAAITTLGWLDAIRLTDAAGNRIPMAWRPWSIVRDLQDLHGTTARARPQYWTERAGTLTFFPTPDAVYTIAAEFIVTPADITTTDAIIPDRHHDLVVWAAVAALAFRQRDFAAAQAADQMYSKVLLPRAIAQDQAEQTQTSTQIRTGYWRS